MKLPLKIFVILSSLLFINWGNTGHRIINRSAVLFFPESMSYFLSWENELGNHASDADYRKSNDPTEGPKHYIDIDNYPEFVSNGYIHQNFDSLTAKHGYNFVMDQGILPWAILETVDSLSSQLQREDYDLALLTAADLGHYVADAHMPLHITRNYNGQYTGQSGIHSRFESNMINRYSSQINYSGFPVQFISSADDFVFQFIYENYAYVDSVLQADLKAKAVAGNTNSDLYYQTLWNDSKDFTVHLFSKASERLASLIYTAWINAGSPNITGVEEFSFIQDFMLSQNYPNPFNPTTTIAYTLKEKSSVSLTVYDILGRELEVLVNTTQDAGEYKVPFSIGSFGNASQYASGVYIYKLNVKGKIFVKKMLLTK
jgi:hypothetical protein